MLVSDIGDKVTLLGSNPKEAAFVDQWVHFAEHEIGVPTQDIIQLVFGMAGPFQREVRIDPSEVHTRRLMWTCYIDTRQACRTPGPRAKVPRVSPFDVSLWLCGVGHVEPR